MPLGKWKALRAKGMDVSADGQNFTDVGSHVFPYKSERRHTYAFAPVSARYVRLTFPDHYPSTNGYSPNFSFTSEVEVYGPAQ